jgi:hypothetical protein
MHQPRDLWLNDGSLRDVYVFDAEPKDWSVLIGMAKASQCRYLADGVVGPLPEIDWVFGNRTVSHLLQLQAGAALLNCHFFVPDRIELDNDPREVVDEATHEAILKFLESLSCGIGKAVSLTAENSPKSPYLTFRPSSRQWSVHAAPFHARASNTPSSGCPGADCASLCRLGPRHGYRASLENFRRVLG